MAVSANTYGSVVGVQRLVGDVVTNRTFDTTTTPTLADVESLLDSVADEINMVLKAAGYSVPVVLATDPEAYGFLKLANEAGASALVLSTMPTESFVEFEGERLAQNRRQFLESRYKQAVKKIQQQELPLPRADDLMDIFRVGSQFDAEGDSNKPLFTRGLTDFPGSRSLT